ncbi:MAG: 3-dehydroquinate synthase, partial [Thermodesulfobacteriota bacterium]
GMVCAAVLSERLNYLSSIERARIEFLITSFGLPHRIPKEMETKTILSRMTRDKKKKGDVIPFVLLKKIGLPFINGGVPEILIRETIEALKA